MNSELGDNPKSLQSSKKWKNISSPCHLFFNLWPLKLTQSSQNPYHYHRNYSHCLSERSDHRNSILPRLCQLLPSHSNFKRMFLPSRTTPHYHIDIFRTHDRKSLFSFRHLFQSLANCPPPPIDTNCSCHQNPNSHWPVRHGRCLCPSGIHSRPWSRRHCHPEPQE